MPRSPHEAVLYAPGPELRPPAERALLVAVWTGVVVFSLAFWAAVMMLLVG